MQRPQRTPLVEEHLEARIGAAEVARRAEEVARLGAAAVDDRALLCLADDRDAERERLRRRQP